MTGEEWITTVFEPALGEDPIRFQSAVDDLGGGLRALEACGLLDPERVAECHRRLHAAHDDASRRARVEMPARRTAANGPSNVLRHVLAPGATPLAEIDGVTVVLASVEVWTRQVLMRAAALNNAATDRLDEEYRKAFHGWSQSVRARIERGVERGVAAQGGPPRDPGERLVALRVALSDDTGTDYRWTGTSVGGTGTEWRLEEAFAPGVPDEARQLTLRLSDPDGQLVNELQFALPHSP